MPHSHRSDRFVVHVLIAAAGFGALALAYLLIVFMRPTNYLVTGWDYLSHQFFLKTFLGEWLRRGEWPLWNPYICCGRPFAADPQSGVFYPPNWLYAMWPVGTTVTLLVTLHIAATGFFTYLLARTLRMSHIAAAIAGVTFMFNTFIVTHAYRGQSERLEAIAYIPLMLLLTERAARGRRFSTYLWLGVVGAIQFVAGSPQVTWMTWVGVGLYLVVRQAMNWRREGARGAGVALVGVVVAATVWVGIAAVQLLPTLELVGQSNRAEPTVEFASAFPFRVYHAIHLLFPCFEAEPAYAVANPEVAGYVGMLPLLLAAVGVLRSRERIRWAIIAIGLLNVFVMIGRATPVFDVLFYVLPGMGSFRLPSRSIVMVVLCAAVLAGFGADALMRGERRGRSVIVGVAAGVSLVVFMWIVSSKLLVFLPPGAGRGETLWIPLAFGMASVMLVALAALSRPAWAGVVWLVVIAVNLSYVGGTMSRYREKEAERYAPPPLESQIVEHFRAEPGYFRFALPEVLVRENIGVIIGQSGVNGFISLSLERYYKFVHAMAWQPVPEKYTHTPDPRVFQTDNPFPFKVLNVRFGTGADPITQEPRVLPRKEEVSRAFFVARSEVIPDDDAAIERMRSPAFDPLQTVILAAEPADGFVGGAADGGESKVEITSYAPKRITLSATAPVDGFLVLSEMDYPGWRATVDGNPVPILRADYLLRAIPLKAGTHEQIEFVYAPASFTLGWVITLVSVALLIVALVLLRKRGKPRVEAAAPPPSPERAGRTWIVWVQAGIVLAMSLLAFPLVRAANAAQYAIIGGRLARLERRESAIESLKKAVALEPDDASSWMNLGTVYGQKGRRDKAIECIERSLKLNPTSVRAVTNLAMLRIDGGDADAAESLLRRAMQLDPRYPEAPYHLAQVLISKSALEAAAPLLEKSVALDPGTATSYTRVARVWTEARQYERAIRVLQLGLSRLPRSAEIMDDLASLLAACPAVQFRNGPEAVRLSELSNALTGRQDPFKLRTLAAAYSSVGDRAKSIEVAQEALSRARATHETALANEITGALTAMGVSAD